MNEVQIFENAEFGKVRTVVIDGEPWLVGKDVAEILGYSNPQKAIRDHVDDDDKGVNETVTPGGKQDVIVINESGLYALLFGSKLPSAKRFKHWVTAEVLPAIRKTGQYKAPATPEEQMAQGLLAAQKILAEKNQQIESLTADNLRQTQIIGELKPKADYMDRILQSKGVVPITAIAKDYGMSGKAMNNKLHELKIIYKMGNQWLLYSKYQAKGYTHSETVPITKSNGMPDIVMNTKWTQKGRLFLYDMLKKHNILPMIEIKQ